MFCPKCGKVASESFAFCPACGFQIAKIKTIITESSSKDGKTQIPNISNETEPSNTFPIEGLKVQETNTASRHPWRRFLARFFDFFLATFGFIVVNTVFLPDIFPPNQRTFEILANAAVFFAFPLWLFFESFLIATFKTTPGKWLFNIFLESENGEGISFSTGVKRSFSLWRFGLWYGFPVFWLIGAIGAYYRLYVDGITPWDKKHKIKVSCGVIGLLRGLIIILGCVFLLVLVLLPTQTQQEQAEFFQAFFSGDPEKVISMCHPAIREKVDAPVLLAYMNSMHDHLGSYTRMSPTDFNFSSNFSGNVKTVEIKGTAEFEKGKAKAELIFQNDVVTSFEIVPENFSQDWMKKLAGTKLFQDRGKEFLNLIVFGKNEKAYSQMHEELKKIITPEKLGEMSKKVSEILGKPKSIVFDSEKMDVSVPNESYLYIDFKVEGDLATMNGQVKFQFIGFKAFILGFYIKP